ncbi:MAG: hypothetical protein Q9160_005656 [Pyrenula sp. 1 TL-2023]
MAQQRDQDSLIFLGNQLEGVNRGVALAHAVEPPIGFIPIRGEQARGPASAIRIPTRFPSSNGPGFPLVTPQNSLRQGFNVPQSPVFSPPQYGIGYAPRVPIRSNTVPYAANPVSSSNIGFTPINKPTSQWAAPQGPPHHGYGNYQPIDQQFSPQSENFARVSTWTGNLPTAEEGLTGLPSERDYGYIHESPASERGLTGLPSESEYEYEFSPIEREVTSLPSIFGRTNESSRMLPPPQPLQYPSNKVMNARGELLAPGSPPSPKFQYPTSPKLAIQLPPLHQVPSQNVQPQNTPSMPPPPPRQQQQPRKPKPPPMPKPAPAVSRSTTFVPPQQQQQQRKPKPPPLQRLATAPSHPRAPMPPQQQQQQQPQSPNPPTPPKPAPEALRPTAPMPPLQQQQPQKPTPLQPQPQPQPAYAPSYPLDKMPPHSSEAGQWLLYLTLNDIKPRDIHRIFTQKSSVVVHNTPSLSSLETFMSEWKAHRFPREWLDPIFQGTRPGRPPPPGEPQPPSSSSAPPSPAYAPAPPRDLDAMSIPSADTDTDPSLAHASAIISSILSAAYQRGWPRDLNAASGRPRFSAAEIKTRKIIRRAARNVRSSAGKQSAYEAAEGLEGEEENAAKEERLLASRVVRLGKLRGEWEGREEGERWEGLVEGKERMVERLVEMWGVLEGGGGNDGLSCRGNLEGGGLMGEEGDRERRGGDGGTWLEMWLSRLRGGWGRGKGRQRSL